MRHFSIILTLFTLFTLTACEEIDAGTACTIQARSPYNFKAGCP